MNNVFLEINIYSLYLNPYKTKFCIGPTITLLLGMQIESKHFFVYLLAFIDLQYAAMYLNIFNHVLPAKSSNTQMFPRHRRCNFILLLNLVTQSELISWDHFHRHHVKRESYLLLVIISRDGLKCLRYATPRQRTLPIS